MKKSNLLALTVPAMLAAVSCGAGVNQKSKLIKPSNAQTSVNIACRNCLIQEAKSDSEWEPISEPTNVFSNKYEYTAPGQYLYFLITADPNDPLALLPNKIDYREGGVAKDPALYDPPQTANYKTGHLVIELPASPVTVTIDATVQCIDFTVVPVEEHNIVSFDYSGALDHVEWDGESNTETEHEFPTGTTARTVKVFGNITSVWFTDRKEPTSNTSLLGNGNDRITELNINHTVKTIPDYAFNGCQGLQKVYIGESVENMGKKVFVMDRGPDGEIEIRDPKSIYCSRVSKPSTWDAEWTDCPVSYGAEAEVRIDLETELPYRLVTTSKGETFAMITGPGKKTGSSLNIPVEVSHDPDKKQKYVVSSIAPFAFFGVGIDSLSFSRETDLMPVGNRCVEIGDYAFACANNLNAVSFDNIIDTGSPFKIGEGAFFQDSTLTTVTFPKLEGEGPASELIIGEKAFANVNALSTFSLPESSFQLTTIGRRAFHLSGFSNFEDDAPYFPSSITTIGDEAFMGCSNLGFDTYHLAIGANVENIGERIFYNSKIESIRVERETQPEGWSDDWNVYYQREGAEPDLIPVVWGYVDKLEDNNIIYYITKQGSKKTATVFKCKSEITGPELVIPASVSYMHESCDVVAIADKAFNGLNSDITSVVIPASVTKVGKFAFSGCSPLLKVFYKGSDTSDWDDMWTVPDFNNEDVGAALYTNYGRVINSRSLQSTRFDIVQELDPKNDESNAALLNYRIPYEAEAVTIPSTITDEDGNTYNVTSVGGKTFLNQGEGVDFTKGLTWQPNNKLKSIGAGAFAKAQFKNEAMTLPASIEDIGTGAFAKTSGVTEFNLKDTAVKSIGMGAFAASTNLADVTLPDGVDVQGWAFYGCIDLSLVDLSKANMTAIPENLFYGCSNYKDLTDEDGNPTGALQLPTTITTIEKSAFGGTGIVQADLSSYNDLTSIGNHAFCGCTSLTSVKLPSSLTSFERGAFGEIEQKKDPPRCENLQTIDLSTNKNVPVVPSDIFDGQLPTAFEPGGIGKIIVPKGDESKGQPDDYYLKQYVEAWKEALGEDNTGHFEIAK